jgi:hypothetical protein
MNYRPRPVFQSYAASNARLMSLNEQFYRSPAAPEFVLFRLEEMDRKMPMLEDGWVLRHLLINYAPVAAEGPFLLLKVRSSESPRLSVLHEGAIELGQPIDLKPYGDADLWLEIEVKPSWMGRVRQFLSRPPTVRLAAWREAGGEQIIRHRAPASLLAAGFLASPLLLNNGDALNLFGGSGLTRPGAYSVELLPEDERCYERSVRFRVYRIENRLGRNISAESAAQLKN